MMSKYPKKTVLPERLEMGKEIYKGHKMEQMGLDSLPFKVRERKVLLRMQKIACVVQIRALVT